MVKIRLKRFGRTHSPFYRICVIDSRSPRDGRTIADIGTYNPVGKDEATQVTVHGEVALDWLRKGAQPSDTVRALLKRVGIKAVAGHPEVTDAAALAAAAPQTPADNRPASHPTRVAAPAASE